MNRRMIGPTPKPWDMYDNWKKDMSTNDWTTNIQSFPLHCSSKNMINKIYSNYMNGEQNINFRKNKMKVDIER
jgi:hypothetical protein